MADQSNDEGYCIYRRGEEITQGMIAEKTGLGLRTVQRHIAEMLVPDHKYGVLEIVKEAVHHSPPEYRLKVDKLVGLKRENRGRQGRQIGRSEGRQIGRSEADQGRQSVHEGRQIGRSHIRCLDVDSHKISLSTAEREILIKDLRRIFPSIHSIPAGIPMERAYLFLHRVKSGDIQRERLYSPIAYMSKMLDEDISEILIKDRERRAKAAAGKR